MWIALSDEIGHRLPRVDAPLPNGTERGDASFAIGVRTAADGIKFALGRGEQSEDSPSSRRVVIILLHSVPLTLSIEFSSGDVEIDRHAASSALPAVSLHVTATASACQTSPLIP